MFPSKHEEPDCTQMTADFDRLPNNTTKHRTVTEQQLTCYQRARCLWSAILWRNLLPKLHPISTDKKLIRMGAERDGGYLVPNDLEGIEACFSPGVDQISKFEQECAERGMKVFMADASVDKPAEEHPMFDFRKSYIGEKNQRRIHYHE